ncbi:MAG: non-hydrolyzing UDP-N-acetylglucosamine 2-epimerase [bacterium]
MPSKPSILFVFGTRPEAIKLAPLIREIREHSTRFSVRMCVTAQHRDLLDFVLRFFDIAPDHDLDLMRRDQSLSQITTRALTGLQAVLAKEKPALVVVQGDTTTALAAALTSFYLKIPVAHIEAGLRTHDLSRPFPEELNRQIIDRIANLLFAPTPQAAGNLRAEGLSKSRIFITGNTAIDALRFVTQNLKNPPSLLGWGGAGGAGTIKSLSPGGRGVGEGEPQVSIPLGGRGDAERHHESFEGSRSSGDRGKIILLTIHRRESFGAPMLGVFKSMNRLIHNHPGLHLLFPVHPNPSVRKAVRAALSHSPRIHLLPPLSYSDFVSAMMASDLILTDSGGVQEEAPYLRKPFLVLRKVTERPEGIALGFGKLVGFDPDRIYRESARILKHGYPIPRVKPPYGDGKSSVRIRRLLESHL